MSITLQELVVPMKLDKEGFSNALKGVVGGVAAAGAAVAGAMALAVKSTFEWANDLDSLGDVMDGTNAQMAAMAFTARKAGVGVDKVAKANVIFQKGLLKTDGTLDTVGKALAEYGISVKDINGKVKDSIHLTDDITNAYSKLNTQQERVNFLTAIYGKNGAEMVDFYDTLAKDGGIDAVTKKVEALGLAIDPNRYEQFNRNLEELKLIGLSLAVAFTENVMPILERFLNWFTTAVNSPEFKAFKKEFENFASDVATAIENGDWDTVYLLVKDKLRRMDDAAAKGIDNINWGGIGLKFGNALDATLSSGIGKVGLPKTIVAITDGMDKAIRAAGQGTSTPIAWSDYWRLFFDNTKRASDPPMRTFFINWETSWTTAIRNWGTSVSVSFNNAFASAWNTVAGWLAKLDTLLGTHIFKVPTVSMQNSLGQVVGSVSTTAHPTTTTTSSGGGGSKKRATGGAVIAGRQYSVAEFYKPETFTPNTSGRVDKVQPARISVDIDYAKLASVLSVELAKVID
jgi:hypothetical protein